MDQRPVAFGKIDSAFVAALKKILDERIDTSPAVCEQHGRDESYHPAHAPDVVVHAQSTAEVSALLRLCSAQRVPVVPYGAGTSLEGHIAAVHGGVCLDLSTMNRVLAVHAEDLDVTVQPGVTRETLNRELRHARLFFAVDPGANASLGGMPAAVAEHVEAVRSICTEHGATTFRCASNESERARLWEARHKAGYASMAQRPGAKAWATDVCVPISRLAECTAAARTEAMEAPFPTMVVGHVGDGNFHLPMLVDGNDAAEVEVAIQLNERVVRHAFAMDGTCTGEHGIGLGKREFLLAEHGPIAVEVMRSIKRTLDPLGILNPGKMFLDLVS